MPTPQLWNLHISCIPALAESIGDALADEALTVTLMTPPRTKLAEVTAIYNVPPDAKSLHSKLAIIALINNAPAPRFTITEMGNLDWIKKVAGDFPPLPIARWVIYGAVHKDKISNPRRALQIDATSAFGTGEHPTTRGCLIMLHQLLKQRRFHNMLDVGCGSGILSMAFAQASHKPAMAVELDEHSVTIAKENMRINGLAGYMSIKRGNGYRLPAVKRKAPYDLVMANIFARPLCEMAKDLKAHLRPGGIAILSGLLNVQANAVLAAHRQQGLFLIKRLRLGEWSVLALQRPVKHHGTHEC